MKKFEKVKNIHFVGIGGAGMIGIARVLLKKGYKVSGSDIDYSNDLKKLKNDGAIVYEGHDENNIKDKDLLVVSSAIDSENVELLQAKKDSIVFFTYIIFLFFESLNLKSSTSAKTAPFLKAS